MPPTPLDLPLAYLDPGSGALIVQMLLAGVAGIVLFVKMQGRRVLALFGRRSKHQDPPEGGGGPG